MVRKMVIVVVLILLLVSVGLYNKFLAPPPSAVAIRELLASSSMPQVAPLNGNALPSLDSELQFTGIYPLSWGVVAVYHTDHMQGEALLKRTFLGWDFTSYSWGPINAFDQHNTIAYEHTHAYNAYVLKSAEIVWGRSQAPTITAVAVTFDDGTTLTQRLTDSWFAVVTDAHGGACMLTTFNPSDTAMETIQLEPRDPPGLDASAYDCKT